MENGLKTKGLNKANTRKRHLYSSKKHHCVYCCESLTLIINILFFWKLSYYRYQKDHYIYIHVFLFNHNNYEKLVMLMKIYIYWLRNTLNKAINMVLRYLFICYHTCPIAILAPCSQALASPFFRFHMHIKAKYMLSSILCLQSKQR